MTDALIIGGGAAGMMAAIQTAARGRSVLLLERNPVWDGSSSSPEKAAAT